MGSNINGVGAFRVEVFLGLASNRSCSQCVPQLRVLGLERALGAGGIGLSPDLRGSCLVFGFVSLMEERK